MAVSTFAGYQTRLRAPFQRVINAKTMSTTILARMMSQWVLAAGAGAAPTTAAVPTSATAGALGQFDSAGTQRILGANIAPITSQAMLIIADRLSHQGGLSGTVTGAQTTNLATAALTRQTSGVQVMAGLEIYTAVGTTGTTVTASYTNQAGTAGQTSIATPFGATGFREAGRMILLPLAGSDTGVRAVASVTLAASTVSAAGNFGVTLFRPLYMMAVPINPDTHFIYDLLNSGALAPIIDSGACLFALSYHSGSNQTYMQDLLIGED